MTNYNKVDNNSWKITVTLTQTLANAAPVKPKITVYPVPFTTDLTIENASELLTMTIMDATGKIIRTVHQPTTSVEVSDLAPGLYVLQMKQSDGSVSYIKAVKE